MFGCVGDAQSEPCLYQLKGDRRAEKKREESSTQELCFAACVVLFMGTLASIVLKDPRRSNDIYLKEFQEAY